MDTKNINLFVYDTKENFDKSKQFLGQFKDIICVEKVEDLDKYFETTLLLDEEYVYLVVHAFAFDKIKGLRTFLTSGIPEKYSQLGQMYISDGVESDINHLMVDEKIPHSKVFKYHEVYSNLKEDRFKIFTKKEILSFSKTKDLNPQYKSLDLNEDYPKCDYVIITALEEDEMEKVLPMITKTGTINNKKHLIEYGYITEKPEKKIAYASQQATGMIDASILATELIILFKPKFLIMSGVLGGKPDINIGNIIVSTKVFTIDKGKITMEQILKESETEKFEKEIFKPEIESVSLDSSYITKFIREKQEIINFIKKNDSTRKKAIDILFGPVACVRQVIDQKGFFEENILIIDRKTIGLEMESYGISRACELVNDGKTTPLIIKSVMDNTSAKVDDAKTYAAWTSAMFVKYILINDLI